MPFRWRPDADLVRSLPSSRRIIPFLMRRRNEAVVYLEQKVPMAEADSFLRAFRRETGRRATRLSLIVWAAAQAIHLRPRLNRFVAGNRLFARRGIWVSLTAKPANDDDHPPVVVKLRIDPDWPLERVTELLDGALACARAGSVPALDRLLSQLLRLPPPAVLLLVRLQELLDRLGLLPGAFYEHNPLYGSLFIANLGSIGLDAGYHHLFHYGNIPIFIVVGRVRHEPVVTVRREVVVRRMLTLRYTIDERIEDGLYYARALELFHDRLEHPGRFIPLPARAAAVDLQAAL